jgi:hypothetical protein
MSLFAKPLLVLPHSSLSTVVVLLLASHALAGGIEVLGTGTGVCPATYPTSIADVPGLLYLFMQTDMCSSLSRLKYTCHSNSTVSAIRYSDSLCTQPLKQYELGLANTCIVSPRGLGSGILFFSCDSPTSLPPFVLKNGGILTSEQGPTSSSHPTYSFQKLQFIFRNATVHCHLQTK